MWTLIANVSLCICLCIGWPAALLQAQNPSSQSAASRADDPHTFAFSDRTPRYELRPGDVVELGFDFSPEFNQTATVQPDGFVSLKGVGDLHVSGLTVPELTGKIKAAYGTILNQPVITVVLKDFERPYFVAGGQVSKPGKYELRGDTNLTEAIAIAGGFSDSAKHSEVVLFRRVSRGYFETHVFDIKKMMKTRNLQEDAYLKPGDMVYVPKSGFSSIRRYIPAPGVGMYMQPAF